MAFPKPAPVPSEPAEADEIQMIKNANQKRAPELEQGESLGKSPTEASEFERIYGELERETYEAYKWEANRREALARLDVKSGFWSDQRTVKTPE